MKAIVIHQAGGPEVLKLETVPTPNFGKDEVLIRQTAIGVNYIDTYHRSGLYPLPKFPAIIGVEACGIVEDMGENVSGLNIGDRVAYATAPAGAYAEMRAVKQDYVVSVPPTVSDEQVAGSLLKGMTAHYLLRRTFLVKPEHVILVHAAAGGVGLLMCQWARALGVTVIGTVGSDEKAQIARANGCTYPINYNKEDFVARVKEITGGRGVNVVYDSVGKDTFIKSLECLGMLGLMVSYGQASGPVPPFDIGLLAKNSLFLTRPSLFNYKANRMELILSATEVFHRIEEGDLTVNIHKRYPLSEAAQAHSDLEARQSVGSFILDVY